jgi:hypothetical protein
MLTPPQLPKPERRPSSGSACLRLAACFASRNLHPIHRPVGQGQGKPRKRAGQPFLSRTSTHPPPAAVCWFRTKTLGSALASANWPSCSTRTHCRAVSQASQPVTVTLAGLNPDSESSRLGARGLESSPGTSSEANCVTLGAALLTGAHSFQSAGCAPSRLLRVSADSEPAWFRLRITLRAGCSPYQPPRHSFRANSDSRGCAAAAAAVGPQAWRDNCLCL